MTGAPMTFPEMFDLPLAVDLRTAARAFGVCSGTAYRMIRDGRFPCPVIRVGHQYRIPTLGLMTALGVEITPADAEHLEIGMRYVAQQMEERR